MKKHKTGIVFTLIILGSAVLGAAAGIGAVRGGDFLLRLFGQLGAFLRQYAVWGMGLVLLVQLGWGIKLLLAAQRTVGRAAGEPEDDTLLEQADGFCDRGVSLMSICNILAFVCMGLGVADLILLKQHFVPVILTVALYILSSGTNVWFTNRFVKLTGQLYPEKTASILSTKFHAEWFASCDEAERHRIGQASYRALRAGQNACSCVLTVVMLSGMFLHTGILPILAVGCIWLVLSGSYLAACFKQKRAA